jgi:hypothetical protein
MKKVLILSAFAVLVTAGVSRAQVVPPPTTPPPTAPPPTAGVPLDPFSWLMLGAGGAAAAGRYYKNKKK